MPGERTHATVDVPLMPWERGGDTGGEDTNANSLLESAEPSGAPRRKSKGAADRKSGSGRSAREDVVDDGDELEDDALEGGAEDDGDELEDDGGEADDAEDDEGDGEGDEDEDSEGEDDGKRHKVTLPGGKTIEVTYAELLSGYSRTADYTRKTQELATQRNELNATREEVRGARAKYVQLLSKLDEAMQGMEPDWEALRKEDPNEFAVQWAEWQQQERGRAAVTAQRQRVLEEQMREDEKIFLVQLEDERQKLLDAIPAWKDEAVATKERTALVTYAKGLGFTDQQLKGIYDHRLLVMLRKAYLYDQKRQHGVDELRKRRKRVETALNPGSRPADPAGRGRRNNNDTVKAKIARDRLKKSGSVDAAAEAFLTAGLIE